MDATSPDITQLLSRWRDGDSEAEALLLEQVYPVLRRLAQKQLSQGDRITLVATELANEAYFKLVEQRAMPFQNRAHFYAIAAHVIRRLLVDHLRERAALKRGRGVMHVTLRAGHDVAAPVSDLLDALDLDRLLQRLERINARAGKVVELRYFGGLSIEETAEAIGISLPTTKRDWQFARAWLHQQLS